MTGYLSSVPSMFSAMQTGGLSQGGIFFFTLKHNKHYCKIFLFAWNVKMFKDL